MIQSKKICVCSKILPYETKEDKLFFEMYHLECTDDFSILKDYMV